MTGRSSAPALLLAAVSAIFPGGPFAAAPSDVTRVLLIRVADRLDRPEKGVAVCILPDCGSLAVETTADGIRIALPPEAGPLLRFQAPGFARAELELSAAATEPIVFRMKANGAVAASFVSLDEKREENLVVTLSPVAPGRDGGPGRVIAERKLTLPSRPKSVRTEFDDVPEGTWALAWSGPTFAAGTVPVKVAATSVDAGNLVLRRGITIAGAVRDDLGVPLAGARVLLSEATRFDAPGSFHDEVRTGADGGFVLSGAPEYERLFWSTTAPGCVDARGTLGGHRWP